MKIESKYLPGLGYWTIYLDSGAGANGGGS
jgi:hypothetical protein